MRASEEGAIISHRPKSVVNFVTTFNELLPGIWDYVCHVLRKMCEILPQCPNVSFSILLCRRPSVHPAIFSTRSDTGVMPFLSMHACALKSLRLANFRAAQCTALPLDVVAQVWEADRTQMMMPVGKSGSGGDGEEEFSRLEELCLIDLPPSMIDGTVATRLLQCLPKLSYAPAAPSSSTSSSASSSSFSSSSSALPSSPLPRSKSLAAASLATTPSVCILRMERDAPGRFRCARQPAREIWWSKTINQS
jgi:hypothetical protein